MLAEFDSESMQPPHLSWQALYELAERAPFGIYIVDAELHIALINTVAQERTFRNVKPAVGRDFAEAIRILWPEDVAASIVAEFRRTLATGASHRHEDYIHPRADSGEIESYDWELHRITLPDGGFGVACYYYETTRLRDIQQTLRGSRDRQAFLLTFSDTLRAQTDEDAVSTVAVQLLRGKLQLDNCFLIAIDMAENRAVVTHQAAGNDLVAAPWCVRISDLPVPLTRSFEQSAVCTDVARDAALNDLDRAGLAAMNVGAWVVAAVRRGERNPIWALSAVCSAPRSWTLDDVALIEDVAERTWSAIERARAEQALRNADKRKDEFLAMLAHELRNPLAAISNAGHVLMRSECTLQTLRATAEILNRQVDHMVRQVDDLLDMSRISRGRIELRKECINLAKIASHALESTRPQIESAHHELELALPPAPLYVLGDPTRLAQAIGNLLNNAAKFTNRGGRIRLAVEQEQEQAVVRVRDNGIGIPAGEQERIFELFVQVDEARGNTRGGLGLGLALVRKLIELHGGTVSVHSKGPTHGTEFVVRLPMLTGLLPEQPEAKAAAGPAPRRRVLVVDDNRDSANSLATLLQLMGHEADTAHDGVEAVKKAVTFGADLILLDIGMPRLNGYEAVSWIREQGHRNLTIVALTGWGQEADRRRSAEAGFDAHVVKPIDVATLTKLLAESGRKPAEGGTGADSGA